MDKQTLLVRRKLLEVAQEFVDRSEKEKIWGDDGAATASLLASKFILDNLPKREGK